MAHAEPGVRTPEDCGAFRPRGLLAGRHVQSILNSGYLRRRKLRRTAAEYRARSRREVITTPGGVHLLGYANRTIQEQSRGQVILLHGWEGSADSNYLVAAARALDAAGFDTFRLNFRDHGESHHLNEELFHSCRLNEVLEAVAMVAARARPAFLAGFSLGGNFALRIARQGPAAGLALDRVIAVSPVVRPAHVLDALEDGLPLYQQYFVRKWRRSLQRKQLLFPERYGLDDWFRIGNLREQTRVLVEGHTDFPHLQAYLEGYSIAGDYLAGLETPSTVITSADDPIIPIRDIRELPVSEAMELEVTEHGGHCGFLENWRLDGWIEKRIVSELCRATNNN